MVNKDARRIPRTGTFLGIPYDWRPLTGARVRQRVWNPDDPRLFTPKALGWGYDVNVYQLLRRIGLIRRW